MMNISNFKKLFIFGVILIKISVIIPVYNTAKYIDECLDSVLNQSFTDFEIICVDDGSSDSSLLVLENYQSKDNRIKIISQEHMGVAVARNTALKQASGEYILFMDSDDFLEKDCLYNIYNLSKSNSLDLLMFKLINFDENIFKKVKSRYFDMKFLKKAVGDNVFNWRDIEHRLFDISVTAPGKLFKRDLIENIDFPEGLIFEDNVFFIKSFLNAKRVMFLDEYCYVRRLRSDSIINSYYSRFSDCIIIYDIITDFIKKMGLYDELAVQLFDRRCKDIFIRFCDVDDEYKQDYFDKIKRNFSNDFNMLKNEGTLDNCSERSLEIFSNALKSDSYNEFELKVTVFDLQRKNHKLQLKHDLSKLKYQKEINDLAEINKKYASEIASFKNSLYFRIKNLIKRLLRK